MKPCAEIHEPEKTPTEQDKVEKLAGSVSPLVQLWPFLGQQAPGGFKLLLSLSLS